MVIRPMYSNPPVYGARLVTEILSDDALSQEWSGECKVRACLRCMLPEFLLRRRFGNPISSPAALQVSYKWRGIALLAIYDT